MSTCYINCAFCNEEIGSAHEMVIMAEEGDNITMAAHPDCASRVHRLELNGGQVGLMDTEDKGILGKYRSWYVAIRGRNRYVVGWDDDKHTIVYLHRLIMDCEKGLEIDHINHNGLDNRKINLRVVSRQGNCRNQRKSDKEFSSRYKGVSLHKSRGTWRATIKVNGKQTHIGEFKSEKEASRLYDLWALKLFGEHAHTNSIPECAICGDGIDIASDLYILLDESSKPKESFHDRCWFSRERESERRDMEAEYRRDAQRESFSDWDSR